MKAEHTGEKWRNKLFRVLGKEREERKEPERPIEEEISILEREEAIDAAIEMTFPASARPRGCRDVRLLRRSDLLRNGLTRRREVLGTANAVLLDG